jgi:aminomethyltransferase
MTTDTLKTPLHDAHVAWGARMVDFAGWDMPIQYAGITEEHLHTRNACSAFDVSHMGRLRLTGADCQALLDRLCTRNLAAAEVGRCYYAHVCREDGGILDDVIVSRFEDAWGVVCNASNRAKIVAWITQHAAGQDVKLRDETTSTAMVAVQGPRTPEVAAGLVNVDLGDIKRYRFKVFSLLVASITVYRSGYTGEDGYELVVPAGMVRMLLPKLVGTKDKPHDIVRWAGLGARDTLRMEASMPLYGHELTEDWDSLTAGQEWCVDLNKDFIGAEAMRRIKAAGIPRRLVGLELEGRRIARQYYPVYAGGHKVGEVTSGTLSPTLGKSIAMALVPAEQSAEGTAVEVDLGKTRAAARVVKMPFYKKK